MDENDLYNNSNKHLRTFKHHYARLTLSVKRERRKNVCFLSFAFPSYKTKQTIVHTHTHTHTHTHNHNTGFVYFIENDREVNRVMCTDLALLWSLKYCPLSICDTIATTQCYTKRWIDLVTSPIFIFTVQFITLQWNSVITIMVISVITTT